MSYVDHQEHELAKIRGEMIALQQKQRQIEADIKAGREIRDAKVVRMTKKQRIEETWKLPPLTDSLMDVIRQTGFATGSTVLASAKVESNDVDMCCNVPPHVFEGYALNTTNPGYWEQDGFTAIYAHKDGMLYNIICFADYQQFQAWYMTGQIMDMIRKKNIRRNPYRAQEMADLYNLFDKKWARVRVFRALKDVLQPVVQLKERLDKPTALKYNKCCNCGREAINFIDAEAKRKWQEDGVCDRCREEGYGG